METDIITATLALLRARGGEPEGGPPASTPTDCIKYDCSSFERDGMQQPWVLFG